MSDVQQKQDQLTVLKAQRSRLKLSQRHVKTEEEAATKRTELERLDGQIDALALSLPVMFKGESQSPIAMDQKQHVTLGVDGSIIADFSAEPRALIAPVGKPTDITLILELQQLTKTGEIRREVIELTGEQASDVRLFRKEHCGNSFHFLGENNDLMLFSRFLMGLAEEAELPVALKAEYMGVQAHPTKKQEHVFVGLGQTFDATGPIEDFGFNSTHHDYYKTFQLDLSERLSDAERATLRELLFTFNQPSVTIPILGWTVGCAFKTRLAELFKVDFPIAYLNGEQGAAKSKTAVIPAKILGWTRDDEFPHLFATTYASRRNLLADSVTIPMIFDEVALRGADVVKRQDWDKLVKLTYTSSSAMKTVDNEVETYVQRAPVLAMGEAFSGDGAIRDRIVEINVNRAGSSPFQESYWKLREFPLHKLGAELLTLALVTPDAELKARVERAETWLRKHVHGLYDRPLWNATIILAGAWLLAELIGFELKDEALVGALPERFALRSDNDASFNHAQQVIEAFEQMELNHEVTIGTGDHARPQKVYVYPGVELIEDIHYRRLSAEKDEAIFRNLELEVRDDYQYTAYWLAGCWPRFQSYLRRVNTYCQIQERKDLLAHLKVLPIYEGNGARVKLGGVTQSCVVIRRKLESEEEAVILPPVVEVESKPKVEERVVTAAEASRLIDEHRAAQVSQAQVEALNPLNDPRYRELERAFPFR